MSDGTPYFPIPQPTTTSLILHPAVILSISIGAYLVLVIIIIIVRQCLLKRGFCAECTMCGKEGDGGCVGCCIAISESCTCRVPTIEKCLDTCCPKRKQMDCVDIILCQCCAGASYGNTCGFGNCKCDCGCDPGCNEINCLCFQLNFVGDTATLVGDSGLARVPY